MAQESKKSVVPKGAKVPEDHKKKEQAAKSVKVTREIDGREVDGHDVTYKGVDVFVPEEALDDFELLADIAELDKGKAYVFPSILRRMVGGEYQAVLDQLRDETTGRVSVQVGADFTNEVIRAANPS